MGMLSEDMKRVVREQRLGFVATVCPDGTPNLSPKGTLIIDGDSRLAFADLASPQTIANLRVNPSVETNVVDQRVRTGYRFKGTATVVAEGPELERLVVLLNEVLGTDPVPWGDRARVFVSIEVESASALVSPSYAEGASATELASHWQGYWNVLWRRTSKR